MRRLLQTLLLCLIVAQLHAQCQEQDYIALRALYLSTSGDNWTDNKNWPDSIFFETNPTMPTGIDVDIWYGVTINDDGCVIDLSLPNNGLTGSIPPELGQLSNLRDLNLRANSLTGGIPSELGNLSNLTDLNLRNNQLNGSIPPSLGQLSNLINLSLRQNQLSGSIPPEIGNLPNLTDLRLFDNELSGCYDSNLSNLCSQLTTNTNFYISNGNNFDASWEDFCAMGTGVCSLVLPGDCNNDSIVDGRDILYWALAYGYTGTIRLNATTNWTPQPCSDWGNSVNGVNSKHQDANGDGIVDELDLEVIEANFGMTYGNDPFVYNPTYSMFVIEEFEIDDVIDKIRFEVHIDSDTPISAHGISLKINLGTTVDIDDIQININGSALNPDAYYIYIDDNSDIHITLIRTDKIDQIIDGLVCSIVLSNASIVIVDDIQSKSGYSMSTEELTAIGGSTLHGPVDAPISLGLNDAYCDEKGTARVHMADTTDYSYEWSTGENTRSIGDLDLGSYTVTVSDGMGDATVIDFDIDWAFTPLTISIYENRLFINFEEAPLSEAVGVSINKQWSHIPPTMEDVTYYLSDGIYQVFVKRMSDECSTYIGDFTIGNPKPQTYDFSQYSINLLGTTVPHLVYKLEQHSTVDISLYNIHGQRLRTIHHARSDAGTYQIEINKGDLPKGIYFIHVKFISADGTTAYKTLKLMI